MDWQPGDLLAFHGTDLISRVIKLGTCWPIDRRSCWNPPTHVGMIVPARGGLLLFESTTLCGHACLSARDHVAGVQIHDPKERVLDYRADDGQVDLYRLTLLNQLTLRDRQDLTAMVNDCLLARLKYDTRGAVFSATKSSVLLRRVLQADLETVFCSELLAALLQRLGLLSRAYIPSHFSPGRLIRELKRTGVYRREKSWTSPLRLHFEENG